MGILDGKEGGIFGTPSKSEKNREKEAGPADFSDTTARASTTPAASNKADFSDVTIGQSSGASSGGRTYTVKSGDSLSKIARHLYGDAGKWHQIYDANRDKIKDPDLIHPGQEFTIPDA